MTLKVGIVGCGKMAKVHIAAYENIKDLIVVGVCDLDLNKAKEFAVKYNINSYMFSELMSSSIDVIDICTSTGSHGDIVMNAIMADKHVFCEKPLTNLLANALKIKELVDKLKYSKILMSGYLYNFHPAFERLKLILKHDIIGKPHSAIFRIGGRGGHRTWKHIRIGGGAILEVMVHMLDLMIDCFGLPISVIPLEYETLIPYRVVDGKEMKVDAEDYVVASVGYKDLNVIVHADLVSPSYMNYVEIHGSNGSYFGSILDFFPVMVFCKESIGIYNKGWNQFSNERVDLVEKELQYFADVVNGIKENPRSIKRDIDIARMIKIIRRKAGV